MEKLFCLLVWKKKLIFHTGSFLLSSYYLRVNVKEKLSLEKKVESGKRKYIFNIFCEGTAADKLRNHWWTLLTSFLLACWCSVPYLVCVSLHFISARTFPLLCRLRVRPMQKLFDGRSAEPAATLSSAATLPDLHLCSEAACGCHNFIYCSFPRCDHAHT